MAHFEPGHMHLQRMALTRDDLGYDLHVHYEPTQDANEGTGIAFHLHGTVDGTAVDDRFFLPRDQVLPSFLMRLSRTAQSYLTPPKRFDNLVSPHPVYDAMFEDLRAKLNLHSGEPVKPNHLT